ncbi:reverse transcriptase/maturase family protein [Microbispora amethystogenes]|uniref:Maturase n=1 Tax=Microbispora amethystogenes TaxID=1427754 RepID=A0ABQ4FN70_9ACTN|nr:reverse transcriptase/maturase family protein [Microbispora amethystogenes]GIH36255.1 maturase [Microbispora amethystogenes]
MQSAETVLGVLRERGRRGLPLNELYRQLFNPQLYLLAYGRIYANKGAMTPGVTGETVDGMSIGKIEAITEALRAERYRWSPVKRIHIPKKNGKARPLGLPPWSDKLVGEAVRLLLDAYYEPTFSDLSHGFRPGRGCHTALRKVSETWTGTTWFIEGDVADCFGSFDHEITLSALAERIHDGRFLRLMRNMLMAGYLEDWVWNARLSGVPQGGVVSPILSNIYLHRLDDFVEKVLIPHYTRGRIRRQDTAYARVRAARDRAHKRGDHATVRELRKQLRSMPSGDPRDPGFRRLRYVRYCDDTLLGFTGPKAEAEEIKQRLTAFLRDELALELSADKTLITHARTQAARFLGYEITVLHNDRKVTQGRRSANGVVSLKVPASVIKAKKAPYLSRGKPEGRPRLINEDDHTIVNTYGAEWRGIVQYYLLAGNVHRLHRLGWVMETSLLKTLANKHRSSVAKTARRYAATITTPHGPRKCFEAKVERSGRKPLVARFGGIPLRRNKDAAITDRVLVPGTIRRKELITRLLANRCEICKADDGISVHHVRRLADLTRPGRPQPAWAELMATRRRKTLVVCRSCHDSIHTGKPKPQLTQ